MKKAFVIAFFAWLTLLGTSCTKVKELQAQTIDDFLKTYFPDTEMLSTIREGYDYDVTLSDYTQIEFDGKVFGKNLNGTK